MISPATPTSDHTSTLQRLRNERNRDAADAEHLTEELLSYRYAVSAGAVISLQEPSAKPRLQSVKCIASSRLLNLRKQQVAIV
jgi:hypothetical protein